MKVGLLGYGYTASYFAQLCVSCGYQVWGTSRDPNSLKYPLPSGVDIINFKLENMSAYMSNTSCLLISIPPTSCSLDPTLSALKGVIVKNKANYRWIGYLSSTGVYGDHQGEWVDETSICTPKSTNAINRLSAEKAWLSLCDTYNLPVMIFRLSGIYGPKRNALDRLKAGKNATIFKKGHFFSRMHVSDICLSLLQTMLSPISGQIINLSDDHPCGPHEVDCFAADLLQIERPCLVPYEQAELSSMARDFYESNRRVSNAKLKTLFLSTLKYPSYKEGVKGILLQESLF